ncbi:sulfur carrier protein ThiS [Vibrio salinus]|uniref:sulfur carrier protein ThiS n=1 Tax=Vibrio salinus TaxID=2899784 RepID=UPI001E5535C0|nr:sulfur carrier protein ThiS [Vibrio salinus]MCE0493599.1 sulfur carrier protein ThiS [Vibrio salinus]
MNLEIFINDQRQVFNHRMTLSALVETLALPDVGCVVSINNTIIPKSQWPSYQLNSGDQISLFQAIAGG